LSGSFYFPLCCLAVAVAVAAAVAADAAVAVTHYGLPFLEWISQLQGYTE